jgi:AcrR family transcriptional regulator
MPRTKDRPNTRELILDAALDLFVEQGFEGTSISEVERRVGLASGTGSFYRHFSSKQALLHAAVAREAERCMAEAEQDRASLPASDDARERFAIHAKQVLRDLRRFDRLFRLMITEGDRVPEVGDAITAALEGAGAVSWVDDPVMVAVIAALVGYHMFETIGAGPFQRIAEDDLIDAVSLLAEARQGSGHRLLEAVGAIDV